jgi:glycosyltransferase involved in cell wall biosynthesis
MSSSPEREDELRASILIPTHDRPSTLELAVRSALAQTVDELEVLIIGDGATDAVRQMAQQLVTSDHRVRFIDHEKSRNHGEEYRHDAILSARSNAIFYLCDDDLFLPEHVEDLLGLLEEHDFVQSLNGYLRPSGEMEFYPADLADPETIRWHLRTPTDFNSVSLTGTAHRRDFYLAAGRPWTTTPSERWPDHYQWCKLFEIPGMRAATSARMTTLQLPTCADDRDAWSPEERLEELARWAEVVHGPGGQAQIDSIVARSWPRRMERDMRTAYDMRDRLREQAERCEGLERDLEQRDLELAAARRDSEEADRQLAAVIASRSWRLTAPLRNLRRRMRI